MTNFITSGCSFEDIQAYMKEGIRKREIIPKVNSVLYS